MAKQYRVRHKEQLLADGSIHKYEYKAKTYYQERPKGLELPNNQKKDMYYQINKFLKNLSENYLIPEEDAGLAGLKLLLCQVYGLIPTNRARSVLSILTAQCSGNGTVNKALKFSGGF